ncbi:conjugal transfer protein, partial [Actinomadura roseirufa]|uniref:conjugal transfer protein n=1 Tax=Actinomadura roseirufa TaxID=2094049 RepID=UPI001F5EB4BC
MDLPTYTNIWRIEKRLYKLYDLRLPMPLPLVQIGVFAGVFVPWIVLLKFAGIPFESPWHVLYIVPPGVLTWLATRPVIEGKRLTELLLSQSRYFSEPRTWCRLTPIREPREVVIVARVWRRPAAPAPIAAPERAAIKSRRRARRARGGVPAVEPAAVPAAATPPPRPGTASAPQPLAEYAAQREQVFDHDVQVTVPAPQPVATPEPDVPAPAPEPVVQPREPEPLQARAPEPRVRARAPEQRVQARSPEPRVRARAQEPGVPAAPGPRVPSAPRPPKPWRRTIRDISHEDDVLMVPDEVERPPATPQLEIGPGGGKRGVASGVRRPGAAAEFWNALPPDGGPAAADPADRPAEPEAP